MPYTQASELLKNPKASLEDLLNSLQDLSVQYGHISAMVNQKLRENSEIDLARLLVLIELIKNRIKNNYER